MRAIVILLLALAVTATNLAHDSGPPAITMDVGETKTYTIKSDVTSEGGISFYLAHEGFDTNVIRVRPEGTFSSHGDGTFQIRGLAPGKTIVTFGWLYPPRDAGGLFTCEITVNPPATTPPTAANAVSSATTRDPVNLFSGELTMVEPPDLNLGGPMPLYFQRYYGSGLAREALIETPMGDNWSHNFNWRLLQDENRVTIVAWDGRRIPFNRENGRWQLTGVLDIPFQLVERGTEFVLGDPRDNRLYTFAAGGELLSIEDGRGNIHTLTHDGGRLAGVSDGLGRTLTFTSSGFQQLTTVSDGARTVNFGYTNIIAAGQGFFDDYFALFSVRNTVAGITRYQYEGGGGSNHVRALLLAKVMPLGNTPYRQTYNSKGKVATQLESGTNIHTFTYDQATTVITNPLGHTRKVVHTAEGQLASFTDEAGATITILSNSNGQRSVITNRLGRVTSFGYHAPSGKVAAITNANGAVTRFEFAARTNKGIVFYDTGRIIYPDGATEDFTHDAGGNITAFKDRAGKLWQMTYNGQGQELTVSNPAGGQVTFTYNPNGTVASRIDSDSGLVRFLYDQFGRMTNMIRADSSTVSTAYDAHDRVTSVIDERGNTYRYKYDANNNLLEITHPDDKRTQYAYDSRDRLAQVIDRLGHITRLTYDPLENLSAIINRNGNTIGLVYDPTQRLSVLADPAGNHWEMTYDPEGVIATWGNPLGQTQSQESDALGDAIGYTDALARKRKLQRNELQLITSVVDELSRTNLRTYDNRGLLTSVAKPVIGAAHYERNELGQISEATDPRGSKWLREYTPIGRLKKLTDPLNRATSYEFDSRGRLVRTTFADGSTCQHSYDARNNPTMARFSDGTELTYSYDSLNRLVEANELLLGYDAEDRITNSVSAGVSFGTGYDAGGRIVTATYGTLFAVTYEYDSRDHLTRVSDSFSGTTITLTYDAAGRMTGTLRSNGVNGSYSYDPVGRLTRIQEGSIIDIGYTLDAAGQVTQADFNAPLDPATLLAPASTTFTYDAAHQISNPGYSYDPRGRMTAAPGQTYAYDGASRLTRIGGTMLAYNGLNDVVTRAQDAASSRFFYNYALGMGPIVAERNEATGQFTRFYVWSPGGRLLYLIDAATRQPQFFHFDRVGSTLALTDEAGKVVDSYAYSPYGELLGQSGNSTQPFTFVGRYGVRQEAANFYQMRARYYSATSSSFLTPDLLPLRFDDIHSLNPYHYVAGDPLRAVDPEGMDRTIWFFGHAWIEVDVYDAQGKVTHRVALNFAPESGKSDYQVIMPRNIVYPHLVGYDMKSSQLEDELLVREWRRLQNDPNRGQQWNPIKNCIWKSVEYANAEIPMTNEEYRKMLATMPVRTDVTVTAAPPDPWYEEAYDWVGDSWGEFEDWLTDVLN